MRLEVLVENSEPEIYPLSKSEVILGSGDACDIVISAEGMSRKHLKITVDGDNFYVTDQGSTNGSFINEERLIPGRRVEFTSFFPVRLGSTVLLTLLSDEDGSDYDLKEFATKLSKLEESGPSSNPVNDQATRVVHLSDMNRPRTQELVQKRTKTLKDRKVSRPNSKRVQKKDSMLKWYLLAAIILGSAVYYQFELKQNPNEIVIEDTPNPSQNLDERPAVQEIPVVEDKLQESELVTKVDIDKLISFVKCSEAAELLFCNSIPELRVSAPYGAYQRDNNIFLFVDQLPWIEKAVNALPKGSVDPSLVFKDRLPSDLELKQIEESRLLGVVPALYDEVMKIAFLEFLRERVFTMPVDSIKEFNIYLVFVEKNQNNYFVSRVMSIIPRGMPQLANRYGNQVRSAIQNHGYKAGIDMEIFFNFY